MNDNDTGSTSSGTAWITPPLTTGGLWLAGAGLLTVAASCLLVVIMLLDAPHTFLLPISIGGLAGVILFAAGCLCRKIPRPPA